MAEIYKDPNSFGINKYAGRLQANNTSDTGWAIVPASEIGGHRRVATLDDLKNLTVPILSENTTGNDAVGQLWYVDSEACFYQLISWTNRKSIADGWKKFSAGGGSQRVLPIDGVKESGPDTLLGLIKVDDTSAEDFTFSYPTASGAPVSESFDENYGIYFINKWSDPNSSNQGITSTPSTPHPALALKHTDGVFVFGHKDEIGDDSFNANSGGEITTAPANLRLRHHYFTQFKNSDLYAYNSDVEQIFLDPTGQAWKYDEDGLNLIKTDFVSAFTTKQEVEEISAGIVDTRIAELVDGAPEDFDTLKELADAIKSFEGEGGTLEAFTPKTRIITANGGLTGGGNLMNDITISISDGGVTSAKIANGIKSTLSGNALKFISQISSSNEGLTIAPDTIPGIDSSLTNLSPYGIFFDTDSSRFIYANINEILTPGYEEGATLTPEIDIETSVGRTPLIAFVNFTTGDLSDELYAYDNNVSKKYIDENGVYWVWAETGKALVKSIESSTSEDLTALSTDVDTLTTSFETLNSMVTGDSRNLVAPTISATYTVYTNGVAGTPSTISSNPGAIFAGQTASLTSATFKWNAGTTYRRPTSCSGDWTTLPAENTNSSSIDITDITVLNYNSEAKKLTVSLAAPKVGLMVSGTKVVPASGNDTTSKSIAISYKYRVFSGAFTKDPASLTADDIKALTVGEGTAKGKTFTINVDNSTRYAYAYPRSFGTSSISKGVEDQSKFWSTKTISITTSEGWTADYYVYYTTGPGAYSGDSIKFA